MYTVAVSRSFIAQHFLIGGDWGPENHKHSHPYHLVVELEGRELNQHGYLVDIVEIEAALNELLDRYRDRTLNDLPEFSDLNPSIERFARILAQSLLERLTSPNLNALRVQLWENEAAWAAYREEL